MELLFIDVKNEKILGKLFIDCSKIFQEKELDKLKENLKKLI